MRSLEADGLAGVRSYRTESKVFGVQRTVLVTWNQALFDAQCRTLLREIAKRRQHLRALQWQLRRWRRGQDPGGTQAEPGRHAQEGRRLAAGPAHAGPVRRSGA